MAALNVGTLLREIDTLKGIIESAPARRKKAVEHINEETKQAVLQLGILTRYVATLDTANGNGGAIKRWPVQPAQCLIPTDHKRGEDKTPKSRGACKRHYQRLVKGTLPADLWDAYEERAADFAEENGFEL